MSNIDIFKRSGYLKEGATRNLSYQQTKLAIANEIMRTKQAIGLKELEMLRLRNYLSCLEHEDRTVWLLYKKENA